MDTSTWSLAEWPRVERQHRQFGAGGIGEADQGRRSGLHQRSVPPSCDGRRLPETRGMRPRWAPLAARGLGRPGPWHALEEPAPPDRFARARSAGGVVVHPAGPQILALAELQRAAQWLASEARQVEQNRRFGRLSAVGRPSIIVRYEQPERGTTRPRSVATARRELGSKRDCPCPRLYDAPGHGMGRAWILVASLATTERKWTRTLSFSRGWGTTPRSTP